MPEYVVVDVPGALPASIDYYYGLAALGPDYGVGNSPPAVVGGLNSVPEVPFEIPVNVPGAFQPPKPTQIPGNWAWVGPIPGRLGSINRVSSIKLDTGFAPVWFPCFNLAEPQGLYNLEILTADQYAIWETTQGNSDIVPIPVDFMPGGPPNLYGGA